MYQKSFRKHVFQAFILLILFLNCSFIYAQDSLDFALQFQIEEHFSIRDFHGTLISGKYHINQKSAIRIGIGFTLKNQDNKTEQKQFASNTWNEKMKKNISDYYMQINMQYLRYLSNIADTKLYIGAGPFWDYNSLENSNITLGFTEKNEFWRIGLKIIIGIEYFVVKNISFSGEYSPSFCYFHNESHEKNDSSVYFRNTSSGYQIDNEKVRIGISIYF